MEKAPLGTIVKTGETCPESGVYEVERKPDTTITRKKGEKMPPSNWMSVNWKLIKYAA